MVLYIFIFIFTVQTVVYFGSVTEDLGFLLSWCPWGTRCEARRANNWDYVKRQPFSSEGVASSLAVAWHSGHAGLYGLVICILDEVWA